MPDISQEVDINIDVEDFYNECSTKEKNELRELISSDDIEVNGLEDSIENKIALQYFRNEFNLKKFIKAIGINQVEKVLSEIKGDI